MDEIRLEESKEKSEDLLGVTMQSNLKWSQQIESLEDKLKTRLTGLEKLKYVMNRFTKKNIVQGVFNSVLCYCLPCLIDAMSLRLKSFKSRKTEQPGVY